MDALRTAAPLARLLLALGESGRTGRIVVEQRARRARLSIVAGRLVALRGIDVEPLGDALLALGVLAAPVQRALWAAPAGAPIGERLVALGVTSPSAVALALQRQLASGLSALLRWPVVHIEVVEDASQASAAASVDLVAAVWSALFALSGEVPRTALAGLAGAEELVLTATGEHRVHALQRVLENGELAAVSRMTAGASRPGADIHARVSHERGARGLGGAGEGQAEVPRGLAFARVLAGGPAPELHAVRALLRVLGGAVARAHCEDACALLLRKRRELARNASARRLLDLPDRAGAAHARRALRRLARRLHPDRFEGADARLRAVSNEVMGALLRAERELRCG